MAANLLLSAVTWCFEPTDPSVPLMDDSTASIATVAQGHSGELDFDRSKSDFNRLRCVLQFGSSGRQKTASK